MSEPELVEIDEAIERWSDIKLADGAQVRVKMSVLSVYRLPGKYDAAGNQAYHVNWVPTMGVLVPPPRPAG